MGKLLKIVKVGAEAAVILPPDVLQRLQAELGGTVRLEETPLGYSLVRSPPSEEEMLQMAEQIMDEDQEILRVLAQ